MASFFRAPDRGSRGRPRGMVHDQGGGKKDQPSPGGAARAPHRPAGHAMSPSKSISPTAHYTGYVWARNGLSHPALETTEGRLLFEALRPAMTVNAILGRGTLESYLLARHRAIDTLLERAIDEHGIRQVI